MHHNGASGLLPVKGGRREWIITERALMDATAGPLQQQLKE